MTTTMLTGEEEGSAILARRCSLSHAPKCKMKNKSVVMKEVIFR